jgi:hypothetical protein
MFQYRVTKYDPAFRIGDGRYTRDDWTMFSQVGHERGGALLTVEEYERVEQAYLDSALSFLRESGVSSMIAQGVENAKGASSAPTEGASMDLQALEGIMRGILRAEFWCRLEAPRAFVHFGWDYYMYVGVEGPCGLACELARSRGLFVEPFGSPYREDPRPTEDER